MGDVVAHCGRCVMKELKMVMGAQIDETLGLTNMVGTSPWYKSMDDKSSGGPFELFQSHGVSCN